ncbi:YpmS family protein [Eupransor demetentiae]|uniref:DUF2140 family (YpmS) n=1 Tax=Eupransor demetentiae TaxID=3109584 RepID=A0ABM9N3X0_9LACO|nr:DUF2140 family (YpmS) [Lactobacillaceae bacterium LMG 33000]
MKKHSGLWFYLFWLLILAIFAGGLYTAYLAFAPTQTVANTTQVSDDTSFDINLNREQVNGLAATYLNDTGNGNFHFKVGEENVTASGAISILGQKINAVMTMTPEVTNDGNIVLKTKSISLGKIDLPTKVAMGYVKQMYDGPEYVQIQPDQEQITINMSKVSKNKRMKFKAKQIDLKDNQFKFIGVINNG